MDDRAAQLARSARIVEQAGNFNAPVMKKFSLQHVESPIASEHDQASATDEGGDDGAAAENINSMNATGLKRNINDVQGQCGFQQAATWPSGLPVDPRSYHPMSRIVMFNHANAVKCTYRFEVKQFLRKITASLINESVQSDIVESALMDMQMAFLKAPHNPVAKDGRNLRVTVDGTKYSILLELRMTPSIARHFEHRTMGADYVEYLVHGGGYNYDKLYLKTNHTKRLSCSMYTLVSDVGQIMERTTSNNRYIAIYESEIDQFLTANGSILVDVTFNCRLQKFASLHCQELFDMREDIDKEEKYGPLAMKVVKFLTTQVPEYDEELTPTVRVGNLLESSPFFYQMLFGQEEDTEEKKKLAVVFKDYSLMTLHQVVQFIYKGPTTLMKSGQNLNNVYKFAHQYMMYELKILCLALMMESITASSVIAYFELAYTLNIPELKMACFYAFKERPNCGAMLTGEYYRQAFAEHGNDNVTAMALTELFQFILQRY